MTRRSRSKQSLSQQRNINAVSRELGISSSQLSKWCGDMKVYKDLSFSGRGVERLTDEQREIKELCKQLKYKELDLEKSNEIRAEAAC